DRQARGLGGRVAAGLVGAESRLPFVHPRHAGMAPQADDAGVRRDPFGAPEICDLHVDIGDPAVLAADMLADLDGKAAIVFDVLGLDHGTALLARARRSASEAKTVYRRHGSAPRRALRLLAETEYLVLDRGEVYSQVGAGAFAERHVEPIVRASAATAEQ